MLCRMPEVVYYKLPAVMHRARRHGSEAVKRGAILSLRPGGGDSA